MTSLPKQTEKKLGLAIDLDTCVGCHACVISCKEWNTSNYGAPLSDIDAYGEDPVGVFLNRVHTYEIEVEEKFAQVVHFPKSCLHCDDAPCVTVCPTGASYKRTEDGIVLVNEDACIGCGLCAWACPYGAREMDTDAGVMKKCTLCVDRIYNENIPEDDREPAASIIIFTVFSGYGFGLFFWLGLNAHDTSSLAELSFFSVAFISSALGLISSAFHLGNPQRALKAFSQWRSSWLSREAILALLTFPF